MTGRLHQVWPECKRIRATHYIYIDYVNASGSGRRHYRPAFLFASLQLSPCPPSPLRSFPPRPPLRPSPPFPRFFPPFPCKGLSPPEIFSLFLPKIFSTRSLLRSFPPSCPFSPPRLPLEIFSLFLPPVEILSPLSPLRPFPP